MCNTAVLNEKTKLLAADFLRCFDIRSMAITKGSGITSDTEISDISIFFIKQPEKQSLDYRVQFKLQNECADICRYMSAIHTEPVFSIELTHECQKMRAEQVNDKLRSFIGIIRERVKSAQKEQKVQDISFVGNTFMLNNSTKFKVLSDEGEGRLNIEVLTGNTPLDAKLTASGLLDGLYLGSIKPVESDPA